MNANSGSQELSGQVAIVTGAATNTGSTIAKTLAGAGAAVVVNFRSSKEAALETVRWIESSGGRAISVQADVCNQADVKRLVEETVKAFGPPSVLVNNANVRSFRPLMEITPEIWRETLRSYAGGHFVLCTSVRSAHAQIGWRRYHQYWRWLGTYRCAEKNPCRCSQGRAGGHDRSPGGRTRARQYRREQYCAGTNRDAAA